jgi:hypothetical protein
MITRLATLSAPIFCMKKCMHEMSGWNFKGTYIPFYLNSTYSSIYLIALLTLVCAVGGGAVLPLVRHSMHS